MVRGVYAEAASRFNEGNAMSTIEMQYVERTLLGGLSADAVDVIAAAEGLAANVMLNQYLDPSHVVLAVLEADRWRYERARIYLDQLGIQDADQLRGIMAHTMVSYDTKVPEHSLGTTVSFSRMLRLVEIFIPTHLVAASSGSLVRAALESGSVSLDKLLEVRGTTHQDLRGLHGIH